MKRVLPGLGDYWRMWARSGFRRAWTYFWDNHFFDLVHGTNTAHWLPKDTVSAALVNAGHGYGYEASYTSTVLRAIRQIQPHIDLTRYGFFDVGCGKGKAVLMASRFPFGRVCGIEYDPRLVEVARWNFERVHIPAQVVQADATTFSEYGTRAVIYLYNPFDEVVLRAVAGHLERLEDAIVIYTYALHPQVFDRWKRIDVVKGALPQQSSIIFRHSA